MKRFHPDEVIFDVCRQLVAEFGAENVTRATVQAALRERAKDAGARPVGADHQVVGVQLDRAKEEVRQGRIEAARSAASTSDVELPSGLDELLGRHAREVQERCRSYLASTLERSRVEADTRVAQVATSVQSELFVVQADLEVARTDRDALAGELDHASEHQEALEAKIATTSTELVACTTNLAELQRGSREELALINQDLRLALGACARAEERAVAAERLAGEADALRAPLIERIAVLEAGRDASRDAAGQFQERFVDAERRCAEAIGRMGALEDECAWLRRTLDEGRVIASAEIRSRRGSVKNSPTPRRG